CDDFRIVNVDSHVGEDGVFSVGGVGVPAVAEGWVELHETGSEPAASLAIWSRSARAARRPVAAVWMSSTHRVLASSVVVAVRIGGLDLGKSQRARINVFGGDHD